VELNPNDSCGKRGCLTIFNMRYAELGSDDWLGVLLEGVWRCFFLDALRQW
jgi:hypothetical protein